MFSLAAKLACTVLAASHGALQARTPSGEAWKKIEPLTVVLRDGDYLAGRAALIDSRGYFIAHRTSVPAGVLQGKTFEGKTYKMVRTASDESSGLVLLIAQGWPGGKSVVQLPSSSLPPGTPLLAVNGPGAIPSEIVSSDRFGVLAPSRRLMGLTEVKFESSAHLVGGALLFTLDGRFMGALNATLAARSADSAPQLANTIADKGSLIFKGRSPIPTYGPGELTVAYTVSLDSLRTVIAGFKSPSHNVLRPFLGVVCKDAESGGAYVESVLPESPAERAGIRQGDLIFMIGQVPVHNQVGFAKAMLLQTAGADVNVVTLRHGKTLMQRVTLGQSKD